MAVFGFAWRSCLRVMPIYGSLPALLCVFAACSFAFDCCYARYPQLLLQLFRAPCFPRLSQFCFGFCLFCGYHLFSY